jgi:hypothetical protein
MTRFQKSLLLGMLLFSSQITWADYKPLFGSEWSRAHPNELPFSECYLGNTPYYALDGDRYNHECYTSSRTSADIAWFGIGCVGCGSNSTFARRGHVHYLNCFSQLNNLAYSIAFETISPFAVPSLGFILDQMTSTRIIGDSLQGKSLGDLTGYYQGAKVGLALAGGGHYGRYWNAHKISIRLGGGTVGLLDITLGYSGFHLKPLKQWDDLRDDLKNPFVLTEFPEESDFSPESIIYENEMTRTVLLKTNTEARDIALSTPTGIVTEEAMNRTSQTGGTVVWRNDDSVVVFNQDGTLVYHSLGKSLQLRKHDPRNHFEMMKNYRFVLDSKQH